MASFGDAIDRLAAFYGPLRMPPGDPFGYFVWEVLGTRTTAGRRDAALAAMRRLPALTPDSLKKLGRGRLEAAVRLTVTLVDQRLAALDAGVAAFQRQPWLVERLGAPLRLAWPAARDLPHLGHAGALGLLLFTGSSDVMPVDEGVSRVIARLGLVEPSPNRRRFIREVRRTLAAALPLTQADRRRATLYLRHHAEHTCLDSHPRCQVCPLRAICRHAAAS